MEYCILNQKKSIRRGCSKNVISLHMPLVMCIQNVFLEFRETIFHTMTLCDEKTAAV